MTNNEHISDLINEGYKQAGARSLFGHGSSLGDGMPYSDGYYVEATPDQLFGAASSLGESEVVQTVLPSFAGEPLFHLIVVITLVAYLFMLYRSWGFIGAIWEGIISARHSENRMANEGGALPLSRFKLTATFIGIASTALILVRISDGMIADNSEIYRSGIASYASFVGLLLIGVMLAWNYAFHKIVEWLTYSDFMSHLAAIAHMNFVRNIVVLYPIIAVWCVADQSINKIASILLIFGGCVALLIYLRDTFMLFIGKKISIFYWILYLCTAILLPFSFFAVLLPDKMG